MGEGKKYNVKDKVVIAMAWLFVLALVYLVYVKFKLIFH